MERMTATDELRRLLDERGVEWKNGNFIEPNVETQWGNNCYTDYPELPPFLTISNCTPEQAVAATLGRGTCKNIAMRYLDFLCSECGFVHYIDDSNCTGDGNEWNYCPECGKEVEQ